MSKEIKAKLVAILMVGIMIVVAVTAMASAFIWLIHIHQTHSTITFFNSWILRPSNPSDQLRTDYFESICQTVPCIPPPKWPTAPIRHSSFKERHIIAVPLWYDIAFRPLLVDEQRWPFGFPRNRTEVPTTQSKHGLQCISLLFSSNASP